ncbi:MAG: hypothetical protein DIU74_006220 [Pseudomonadota bacterium]
MLSELEPLADSPAEPDAAGASLAVLPEEPEEPVAAAGGALELPVLVSFSPQPTSASTANAIMAKILCMDVSFSWGNRTAL